MGINELCETCRQLLSSECVPSERLEDSFMKRQGFFPVGGQSTTNGASISKVMEMFCFTPRSGDVGDDGDDDDDGHDDSDEDDDDMPEGKAGSEDGSKDKDEGGTESEDGSKDKGEGESKDGNEVLSQADDEDRGDAGADIETRNGGASEHNDQPRGEPTDTSGSQVEGNRPAQLHKSLEELRLSAASRECHLCYLLYDQLSFRSYVSADGSVSYYLEDDATYPPTVVLPYFEIKHRTETLGGPWKSELALVLRSYLIREDGAWLKDKNSAHQYASNADLLLRERVQDYQSLEFEDVRNGRIQPATLSRLGTWLSECRQDHAQCVHQTPTGVGKSLPTRLLKIEEAADGLVVRLVETKNFPEDDTQIEYATLSYRWGKRGSSLVLLESNYEEWLVKVPHNSLPKTLREAIDAVNALGIKYLWADALCIIQESEDWYRESPRMRTIYSESLVNIAATASLTNNGGLYVQDNLLAACAVRLDLNGLPSRWRSGDWHISSYSSRYLASIVEAPLNSRGWVLQERLLSRRIIHFTNKELVWECASHIDNESQSYRGTDHNVWRNPELYLRQGDWPALVDMYCELLLSFQEDKLMAIAGVAEAFASRHGYTAQDYLAGLWRPDLVKQLLWQAMENIFSPLPSPQDSLAAPSWSWASQTGRLAFASADDLLSSEEHDFIIDPGFEILEASTADGDRIAFGAPRGGTLRVRTVMLEIADMSGVGYKLRDRQGAIHDSESRPYRGYRGVSGRRRPTHALPVARVVSGPHPREARAGTCFFLALQPLDGRKGTFERIDCWSAACYSRELLPGLWSEGRDVDPELYLADCGSGRYEIEIV